MTLQGVSKEISHTVKDPAGEDIVEKDGSRRAVHETTSGDGDREAYTTRRGAHVFNVVVEWPKDDIFGLNKASIPEVDILGAVIIDT